MVEETTLLNKIRRNQMRGQEMQKELEKDDRQTWKDDSIVYVERRIYVPKNQKI